MAWNFAAKWMPSLKLKLGTKAPGTARNMNTVAKLAAMAKEVE